MEVSFVLQVTNECLLIKQISKIFVRYINARNPYYYFSMKDPDDNTIEITGPYDEMDKK